MNGPHRTTSWWRVHFIASLWAAVIAAAIVLQHGPSAADDEATPDLPHLSAQVPSSVSWEDRQVTVTFQDDNGTYEVGRPR